MPTLAGIGLDEAGQVIPVPAPSSVRVREPAPTIVEELDASAILEEEAPPTMLDPREGPPPSEMRASARAPSPPSVARSVPPALPSGARSAPASARPSVRPPASVAPPSIAPASAVPPSSVIASAPTSLPAPTVRDVAPPNQGAFATADTEMAIPVPVEIEVVVASEREPARALTEAPAVPVFAPTVVPAPVAPAPVVAAPVAAPPAAVAVLGVVAARQVVSPLRLATPMPVVQAAPRHSLSDPMDVLFDAAYDLCFLESAVEGARHAMMSGVNALGARAGLAHLVDGVTGEFVTVAATGQNADSLLMGRHADDDWLLSAGIFKGRPITMEYGGEVSSRPMPRHATLGVAKNVIVVPVIAWGRTICVLEIVDASEAATAAGRGENALAYLAERLAEFLGQHEIIVG